MHQERDKKKHRFYDGAKPRYSARPRSGQEGDRKQYGRGKTGRNDPVTRRKRLLISAGAAAGCAAVVLVLRTACMGFGMSEEGDQLFACLTVESAGEAFGEKHKKPIQDVECILQNPELPTGCEATAGTMLLRAYGYHTEKTRVAELLNKGELIEIGERIYGPDPDEAFIGDPSSLYGYGAFPGVLADAMQQVIDGQGGGHTARALYGLSEESILAYIDNGVPLCVWSSMDNREIEYRTGWYLISDGEYTEEYFLWPGGEHCVVLTGYDDEVVSVCDPIQGVCVYPRDSFFRHYEQVGEYALALE